jgi:hypothetical protein
MKTEKRGKSPMSRITDAKAGFDRAQSKVAEAERARDEAFDRLEGALAEVGWTRLRGAFHQGATPLYVNIAHAGSTLTVDEVLQVLEQQARAAA